MYTQYKEDLEEINKWVLENEITPSLVYLMPEGLTRDKISSGTKMLEEKTKEHGYNVTTRLQILLHGDKRAI